MDNEVVVNIIVVVAWQSYRQENELERKDYVNNILVTQDLEKAGAFQNGDLGCHLKPTVVRANDIYFKQINISCNVLYPLI